MGNNIIIRILLMKGANIEVKEDYGLTPLDIVIIKGHTKAMRLLISRGARIDYLVIRRAIRSSTSVSEDSHEQRT